jgi:uncharacterized membrane protein YGL010W
VKTLDEQLSTYAGYHRNRWNQLTHVVGVPLVAFSILIPMAWLRFPVGGIEVSGAMVFAAAVIGRYFLLDTALGTLTAILFVPLFYAANRVAQLPLATGLWVFGASFVVGWVFQLVGHAIERRRPALVDNLLQALVAPLFLVAEGCFAVGLKRDLHRVVAERLRSASN